VNRDKSDEDGSVGTAVRLYAVDSLGMLGKTSLNIDWNSLRNSESNRDVRMHIRCAMEREH
jgi:hypothetical protein